MMADSFSREESELTGNTTRNISSGSKDATCEKLVDVDKASHQKTDSSKDATCEKKADDDNGWHQKTASSYDSGCSVDTDASNEDLSHQKAEPARGADSFVQKVTSDTTPQKAESTSQKWKVQTKMLYDAYKCAQVPRGVDKLVNVTFHVYCVNKTLKLHCDQTEKRVTPMKRLTNNVHTITVKVDRTKSPEEIITYWYEGRDSSSFFGNFFFTGSTEEKHKRQLLLSEYLIVRDYWSAIIGEGHIPMDGLKAHCINIFQQCMENRIHEATTEIYLLFQNYKIHLNNDEPFSDREITEIIDTVIQKNQENHHNVCLLALLLSTGYKHLSVVLSQKRAKFILESIKDKRKSEVFVKYHGEMPLLLYEICTIAFPEKICLLFLMNVAFPFLDVNDFLRLAENKKQFYGRDAMKEDEILNLFQKVIRTPKIIVTELNRLFKMVADEMNFTEFQSLARASQQKNDCEIFTNIFLRICEIQISKKETFSALTNYLKTIAQIFYEKLDEFVLNQITSILLKHHDVRKDDDSGCLEYLCLKCFSRSIDSQKQILVMLAKHQDSFHCLLPKLLNRDVFVNDGTFCKSVALEWMTKRLKQAIGNIESVGDLYIFLEHVHMLSAFNDKERAQMKKETLNVLVSIPFRHLLPFAIVHCRRTPTFEEHMKEYLKKEIEKVSFDEIKTILNVLFEKHQIKKVDKFQGLLLSFVIETMQPLSKKEPDYNVVLHAFSAKSFWKSILRLSGKDGLVVIKECAIYQNVMRCFQQLSQTLSDGEFDYNFAKQMIKTESADSLAEIIIICTRLQRKKVVDMIIKACQRMIDVERKLQEMDAMLRHITGNLPFDFAEVPAKSLRTILQNIDQLKSFIPETSGIKYLLEYEDNVLLNEYSFIFRSYQKLHKVICSKVFWDVNRRRCFGSVVEDPNKNKSKTLLEDRIKKMHMLFEDLIENYIPSYILRWQPIISHSEVKVKDIKTLCDASSVDEEIHIISEFDHSGIFRDSQRTIIRNFFKYSLFNKKLEVFFNAAGQFGIQPFSALGGLQRIQNCRSKLSPSEELEQTQIWELEQDLKYVTELSSPITEEVEDVLESICESESLIQFLKIVSSEDINILVESVEEYSEQLVRESTISSLIDTERFLRPFLEKNWKDVEHSAKAFLRLVFDRKEEINLPFPNIVQKIDECNANIYSIKALHDKHEDRRLRTLEIIERIFRYGDICFRYGSQPCYLYVQIAKNCLKPVVTTALSTKMKIPQNMNQKEMHHYTDLELQDLRSRAYLLLNTTKEKKIRRGKENVTEKKEVIEQYIKLINDALEVVDIYNELQIQGHYLYTGKDEIKECETKEVAKLKVDLKDTLKTWSRCVKKCRENHLCMNYVHISQIGSLYRYFFQSRSQEDVDSIFQYIQMGLDISVVSNGDNKSILDEKIEYLEPNVKSEKQMYVLEKISEKVKCIFEYQLNEGKEVVKLKNQTSDTDAFRKIKKRKFFIAKLTDKSERGINTMIYLYREFAGLFPEANQVIICSSETEWDDLRLLIRRCKMAATDTQEGKLYCVVNAEILSNSVLEKLSKSITKHVIEENKNVLAVVFRGKDSHPFLEKHSNSVEQVRTLSLTEMNKCLLDGWPSIVFVTSQEAGLGKTEFIRNQCFKNGSTKVLKTLQISGAIDKRNIIQRLKKLNITRNTLLHINIGILDQPADVDLLLFELIVFKYVRYRDTSASLHTKHVAIEVANTVNNTLVNRLSLLANFRNVTLRWEGYDTLEVSQEINSPIQIVCHYLNKLQDGEVDTKDLSFCQKDKSKLIPLRREQCQELMKNYFPYHEGMSFTTINIFLSVLADQLRNLTISGFVTIKNIRDIMTSNWYLSQTLEFSQDINSPVQIVCHYLSKLQDSEEDRKDLSFCQQDDMKVVPLKKEQCQKLLIKYLPYDIKGRLFTTVDIFLSELAKRLNNLTKGKSFKMQQIKDTIADLKIENIPKIRSSIVKTMIELSNVFSYKSVFSSKSSEADADLHMSVIAEEDDDPVMEQGGTESQMSEKYEKEEETPNAIKDMIRWEDLTHVVVVFNRDRQTLSLLHKDLQQEPDFIKVIKTFIERQHKEKAVSLNKYDEKELKQRLLKIACTRELHEKELDKLMDNYVLTPDNVLKFVLILFRIHANVPVVLLGDTGCGKTSLIKKLAIICDVEINILNIHAGVKEQEIIQRIHCVNKKAMENLTTDVWLFIDEINTSEYLGLLSDIVCHRTCLELHLAPNIRVIAACNPYRIRKNVYTAGLMEKTTKTDKLANLVYRVYPLPESLLSLVWDFGTLGEKDEEDYIIRMLNDCEKVLDTKEMLTLFTRLVVHSQRFVRQVEITEYSVSLRDVERCRHLLSWYLTEYFKNKNTNEECRVKAIVLTLHICYSIRFKSKEIREAYMLQVNTQFDEMGLDLSEEGPLSLVEEEQKDIINRMELPKGIAVTDTLAETVYVMMICALNCIPLFVVGKPGCSKTLSVQLLRSNLRGSDSKDSFFKTLPYLYCVTYQGSQSSTSDGIAKAFEKAETYQTERNKDNTSGKHSVRALLVLDEVGQAERSVNNPLKVLHSLLIHKDKDCSVLANIAVIGISNWALDAAKMNRAIHLSRPDMKETELSKIGSSIYMSITSSESKQNQNKMIPEFICQLVNAYLDFLAHSKVRDFHGLRDFYSLVRFISEKIGRRMKISDVAFISQGVFRNFSGLPFEFMYLKAFEKQTSLSFLKDKVSIEDMINDNVRDENCRHLLLITNGEAAIVNVENLLTDLNRDFVILIGSSFQNDQSKGYDYSVIGEVILSMENGKVVILKNLPNIYGNLYDMLNQSYCVVGGRQHCRVALGPDSFPMCCVSRSFRCILMLDESEVENVDPPLLNRFEKQRLSLEDCLDELQKQGLKKLEMTLGKMLKIGSSYKRITHPMLMPVHGRDTLASLIMAVSPRNRPKLTSASNISDVCILAHLVFLFHPEVLTMLQYSELATSFPLMSEKILRHYWEKPVHRGLNYYLKSTSEQKNIIFTRSSVNVNIRNCLRDLSVEEQNINNIVSEKQFRRIVQTFVHNNIKLLIVRFPDQLSISKLLIAKKAVDKEIQEADQMDKEEEKRVLFIVHLDRASDSELIDKLEFLSNWNAVTLDSLKKPFMELPEIYDKSLLQVLSKMKSHILTSENFYWAFSRLHYIGHAEDMFPINRINQLIYHLSGITSELWDYIITWLKNENRDSSSQWLFDMAKRTCFGGTVGPFISSVEKYLIDSVLEPLAVLIYQLEKKNVLQFLIEKKTDEKMTIWRTLLKMQILIHSDTFVKPSCPECYDVQNPDFEYKVPFGKCIIEKVEDLKTHFTSRLPKKYSDIRKRKDIVSDFITKLRKEVTELELEWYDGVEDDYLHDFIKYFSSVTLANIPNASAMNAMNWIRQLFEYTEPTDFVESVAFLHTTFWIHSDTINVILRFIQSAREFLNLDIVQLLKSVDDIVDNEEHYFDGSSSDFVLEDSDIPFIDGQIRKKVDVLVDKVINEVIRTTKGYGDHQINWQQAAHTMLSLVQYLGCEVPCVFTLKFFLELINVINDRAIAQSCLANFRDAMIYKEDVLQINALQVHSAMKTILSDIDDEDTRAKIHSLYVSKCLLLNESSKDTLSIVTDSIEDSLYSHQGCRYFGSVLRYCIYDCINDDIIFENLVLQGEISSDQIPILQHLDRVLENEKKSEPLALILVDIFEQYAYSNFINTHISLQRAAFLSKIATAAEAYRSCSKRYSCKKSACVAYLKSIILLLVERWDEASIEFDSNFVSNLSDILRLNQAVDEEMNVLQLFFLKCLEKGHGVLQLEANCGFSKEICQQFELDDKTRISILELSIKRLPGFKSYQDRLSLYDNIHTREREISEIVQSGNLDDLHGILAYCFKHFYLKQVYFHLADADKQNRIKLFNTAKEFYSSNELYIKLLGVVTIVEDTEEQLLQISEESDANKVQISAFIIYFLNFVTYNKECFWNKMITAPAEYLESFSDRFQNGNESVSEIVFRNCDCGHRLVWKFELEGHYRKQCPFCGKQEKGGKDEHSDVKSNGHSSILTLLIPERHENVSPILQDIIQLLVSVSFLSSFALGYTTKDKTVHILQLENDNIEQGIWERVAEIWNHLCTCLALGHGELNYLLQTVIVKCKTDLFESEIIHISQLQKKLHEIIDLECFRYPEEDLNKNHGSESEVQYIKALLEIPTDDSEKTFSLFRRTVPPNFDILQTQLFISESNRVYPFLACALVHYKDLVVVKYIEPLVKWHFVTMKLCNYKLRRADAKMKFCNYLDQISKEDRDNFEKEFESFKKRWNELVICSQSNEVLDMQLKNVTDNSPISDCFIMDDPSPLYLAIQKLILIQNNFLDKTLEICVKFDCAALAFLKHGDELATIPVASLLDMTRNEGKNIVQFEIADNVLGFSQNDTRLGHGRILRFNFSKIEFELAQDVLFRKTHLSQSLPRIILRDDVFKNTMTLIDKVNALVYQKNLPSGIEKNIRHTKLDRQELLTLSEVLLAYIDHVGGHKDPNYNLIHFLTERNDVFGSSSYKHPYLQTDDEFLQVCHIVALYKLSEELKGENVIESKPEKYRQDISANARKKLLKMHPAIATVFLGALRTFAYRCLNADNETVKTNVSLENCLENKSYWPDNTVVGNKICMEGKKAHFQEVVDSDLYISNICTVHALLLESTNKASEKLKEEVALQSETTGSHRKKKKRRI